MKLQIKSQIKLYTLPKEILSLVYQYDNTYKEIFTKTVLPMLWESVLNRYQRVFTLPDKDYYNCTNDEDEDEWSKNKKDKMNPGTESVKFAIKYLFNDMRRSGYQKEPDKCYSQVGCDFYPYELTGSCAKVALFTYKHNYNDKTAKYDTEDFTKRVYFSIYLKICNKLVLDCTVYNDFEGYDFIVENKDVYDNENSMLVYYENETNMALCIAPIY